MSFTYFDELEGSPLLDFRINSGVARRTAMIPWDKIGDFLNFLFPANQLPAAMPGYTFLRANSVHIEPFIGELERPKMSGGVPVVSVDDLDHDTLNQYEYARVEVEYSTVTDAQEQGQDPVPLLQHSWSAGGEFLKIKTDGLQWFANGSGNGRVFTPNGDDDISGGKMIGHIEHAITWPRVISPPFSAIRSLLGTVNNSTMNFKTGSIAPETLLFLGAELQRDVIPTNDLAWQLTYRFSERVVPLAASDTLGGASGGGAISVGGWNHFWRSEHDKAGFYRLQIAESGDPIFELGNHNLLFTSA